MTASLATTLRIWRWIFSFLALAALILPAEVFFQARGGTSFLLNRDSSAFAALIFPLFGLYALTLVWMQILLGSLMPLWQRLWPRIFVYHRAQGVFALLFAVTHPALLWFGVGTKSYLARDFVAPENVKFLYFGYLALFSIILTAGSALLMRTRLIKKYWRKLHYLNYLVFFSAGVHSYFLGSDIQSTGLRYVWFGYVVTVGVAIALRLTKFKRVKIPPPEIKSNVTTAQHYVLGK